MSTKGGSGSGGSRIRICFGASLGLSRSLDFPLVVDEDCNGVDVDEGVPPPLAPVILIAEVGVTSLGTAGLEEVAMAGNE
jgi:hypothetical protein